MVIALLVIPVFPKTDVVTHKNIKYLNIFCYFFCMRRIKTYTLYVKNVTTFSDLDVKLF